MDTSDVLIRCHQTWQPGNSRNEMEVYSWENHQAKWGPRSEASLGICAVFLFSGLFACMFSSEHPCLTHDLLLDELSSNQLTVTNIQ